MTNEKFLGLGPGFFGTKVDRAATASGAPQSLKARYADKLPQPGSVGIP